MSFDIRILTHSRRGSEAPRLNDHNHELARRDAQLRARQRHGAIRTVCALAADARDATHLLDVLGLDPLEGLR